MRGRSSPLRIWTSSFDDHGAVTKRASKVGSSGAGRLYVEGPDDQHVVRHLLELRQWATADFPEIKPTGGKDSMLKGMTASIRAGTGKTVAFVLDGNDNPIARWQAARSRLARVDVSAPDVIPRQGFVGCSTEYRTRVGVWLMPDNQRRGTLEVFLRGLIEAHDPLIGHAEASTRAARERGAQFREAHAPKAVLHTWLAWQRSPGLPYGAAIKARFLTGRGGSADLFVAWCLRVFGGDTSVR